MIPLKLFNNLPRSVRKDIAAVVYNKMSEEFINEMTEPFHHNFDYDMGHWYKLMLDHCTYNKERKQIKVTRTFNI